MAGVKGRSGGARPNSGPKPKSTPRTRGSVWMQTRARILERDGGLCQCDRCLGRGLPADQVDHRVPLWEGGADDDGNLQAIHSDCHKRKTKDEAARRAAAGLAVPEPKSDPLEFLLGVMNDVDQDPRLRVRAAVAAAQYIHTKTHDGGKKAAVDEKAKTVAGGKFRAAAAPLKLVNS